MLKEEVSQWRGGRGGQEEEELATNFQAGESPLLQFLDPCHIRDIYYGCGGAFQWVPLNSPLFTGACLFVARLFVLSYSTRPPTHKDGWRGLHIAMSKIFKLLMYRANYVTNWTWNWVLCIAACDHVAVSIISPLCAEVWQRTGGLVFMLIIQCLEPKQGFVSACEVSAICPPVEHLSPVFKAAWPLLKINSVFKSLISLMCLFSSSVLPAGSHHPYPGYPGCAVNVRMRQSASLVALDPLFYTIAMGGLLLAICMIINISHTHLMKMVPRSLVLLGAELVWLSWVRRFIVIDQTDSLFPVWVCVCVCVRPL